MGVDNSIEQRVIDYFSSRPDTVEVMPPVTNPVTHIRDMVWKRRDGEYLLDDLHVILEFDDEMHRTGSFYFEVRKLREKPLEGLLFKAEGHYLAYVSTVEEMFYIIPLDELRDWVMERGQCFMVKEKSSNDNPEQAFYKSIGYLLPRNVLKKQFGKVEEVKL